MALGVVALWTEHAPRLTAFRIRGEGLEIGRELLAPMIDDRISLRHACLRRINGGVQVEDLGSRNGTHVGGRRLEEPEIVYPPEILRCGRTVFLLVRDIEKYEGRTLVPRHRLVVGASLAGPCDQLEQAIREETSVAIVGPKWVARTLARSYLASRNGGTEIDAKAVTEPLENVLSVGTATRTVLLEAPNALTPSDLETLATWLETDVRFITCVRHARELAKLPAEIRKWLAPCTITIPEPRPDELPSVVHTAVTRAGTGVAIHATLIETLLMQTIDEDQLLALVGVVLRSVDARNGTMLRGEELQQQIAFAAGHAFVMRADQLLHVLPDPTGG